MKSSQQECNSGSYIAKINSKCYIEKDRRQKKTLKCLTRFMNVANVYSRPTYNFTSIKPCLCWLTNKGLWLARRRGSGEAEEPQEEMSLG